MAEISDLIDFAVNKNPVEFANAFSEIVQQRAAEAIDAHRVEIASSLYGSPEEMSDEDIEDFAFEDDTIDDLDFEDGEETDSEDLEDDEA